ncbi:MAG: HD domain-containing phosphohydrolase, partial [Planctomycetota bacterium]
SLSDALQKQSQDNSRIYVNSGNQFFYVRSSKLPKQNTYLLTYHRPAQSGYISSHALASFRKLTFAIALIIGLTGTILNTFMVKRIMDEDHRVQLKLQDQVRDRTEELVRTKNATIFGLAKLAESRDNDTGEHLDRIRKYVTILANDLQSVYPEIDDEFINHLGIASSLHDIGKVGIPDSILLKPGRLTTHERNIMEKHTLIGGECLEAISDKLGDNDFLEMAKEVAYWHHEQWDGEGYPHRLREFEIPIAARIVAVADVYDALTSQRPYKRGLNHTESRAIIIGGSGQKFDPEIIAAFLRHEEEFQKIAAQFHNHESEEAAAVSGVVSLPSLNVANQSVAT